MEFTKWLSNVKYQPEGQILVNDHPEFGVFKIAEIRGWSILSSMMGAEDAASFQDAVGNFIAAAIQDKIIHLKEEGLDIGILKKNDSDDFADAIRKKVESIPSSVIDELPDVWELRQEPKSELTFGQKVVGMDFNPSGNVVVNELKKLHAMAIDLLIANHDKTSITEIQQAILDEAIISILRAQMMAVKSITFKF